MPLRLDQPIELGFDSLGRLHGIKDIKMELQLWVFKCCEQFYGINIHIVHEIIRPCEMKPRPEGFPDYVLGIINVRGNMIPVIDFAEKCGFDIYSNSQTSQTRIILAEFGEKVIGLQVDEVLQVTRVDDRHVEHRHRSDQSPFTSYINGVPAEGVMNLVDLYNLFPEMTELVDA
jgi:purine-binding chemotaxis protein CheW